MAKLTVMGPYEGPGEKRTAEWFAKYLPDSWHVIVGRKLANATRDDVDFFIVGDNRLFVIEEKYWGPTLAIGDQRWSVFKSNGFVDERENPLNQSTTKARKVAGWIKDKLPAFKANKSKTVIGGVVLSYPDVVMHQKSNYDIPIEIFTLEESQEYLEELDTFVIDPQFSAAKDSLDLLLLDLEARDQEFKVIADYKTSHELKPEPGIRYFEAEHNSTGERVILKCYDDAFWHERGQQGTNFLERETKTLLKIVDLNRSWRYHPPFHFEKKNWTVVPIVRPNGVCDLNSMIIDPERALFRKSSYEIISDAFRALAELHTLKVFHKVLTPERIWFGPGLKAKFNDFYLSHIDGENSVFGMVEDESSKPYRDQEALDSLEYADSKSDVYALAYCLAVWITGISIDSKALIIEQLEADKSEKAFIFQALKKALDDDRSLRPEAAEIVEILEFGKKQLEQKAQSPNLSHEEKFEVDSVIDGRFTIKKALGKGGMGSAWLASDNKDPNQLKVLKRLHSVSNTKLAMREFVAAERLTHDGCSTVVAKIDQPEPGYLVYNYVHGSTLAEKSTDVKFGLESYRRVISRCLKILSYVHSVNYVHGDISPKNIIVDEELKATLIDFGLLSRIGDIQSAGTPATMPPEVAQKSQVDPSSDIYSLAASFILCMLGRPPYVGDSVHFKDRDYTIASLTESERQQWGDDGVALLEVLFQACQPQRESRPKTADEMFELIQRAKPIPIEKLPVAGEERLVNFNVDKIRRLYVRSKKGASASLGISDPFAAETYVETQLDKKLLSRVLHGTFRAVFLTGNPGDGKTSFLQTLEAALRSEGAVDVIPPTAAGWTLKTENREFRAVYDASEATDSFSSDQLVLAALEPSLKEGVTSLFAVNDGRLRQFFDDFEEDFKDYSRAVRSFFKGDADYSTDDFLIVDLKTRSLLANGEENLAESLISAVTKQDLWFDCQSCAARYQCPILANRNLLASDARSNLLELMKVSHLRRRKRSTLRQVRSTLGWLITGDLGCEDVHEKLSENIDLTLSDSLLPELAFSSETTDPLVEEWKLLDPGMLLSPELLDYQDELDLSETVIDETQLYQRTMRRAFFGLDLQNRIIDPSLIRATRAYRYFNEFSEMLTNPSSESLSRILLGISKIVGAPGFADVGLAVNQAGNHKGWSALRPFEENGFTLTSISYDGEYVETEPDLLLLKHSKIGATLQITLDSAEVILRAADGEISNDPSSKSVKYEIETFTNKLIRHHSEQIWLIQPAGRLSRIRQLKTKIQLVESSTQEEGTVNEF